MPAPSPRWYWIRIQGIRGRHRAHAVSLGDAATACGRHTIDAAALGPKQLAELDRLDADVIRCPACRRAMARAAAAAAAVQL